MIETGLPQEILELVFQYLRWDEQIQIEIVCHEWNKIMTRLWRRKKKIDYPSMTAENPEVERRSGREKILKGVLSRCGSKLEFLKLENPRKETLPGRYHEASIEYIDMIIQMCPRLKELNLCHHRFDEVEIFSSIGHHLGSTLETLVLDNCQINTTNPADIEHIKSLFASCVRLRNLSFKGRGFCYGALKVTEDILELLSPELESLDMSMGQSLQIYSLKFCHKFPNLVSLSVQRAQIIESYLEDLVTFCPNLQKLDVSFCSYLRNFSCLTKLKYISTLCFNGLRDHLMDEEFSKICNAFSRNLEHLSIESCVKLTPVGLESISKLVNLKFLSVAGLQNLTDSNLTAIAKRCSKLEELYISYCRKLSESGLGSLIFCREIRVLDVSGVQVFTPEIFARLYESMTKLERLEMISNKDMRPREALVRFPSVSVAL